jgi:hypothetical protein
MKWRSDSVNRTVVDLSLSFFIAGSFYIPINCVSRSNEGKKTANRYRFGIDPVSPIEEFSLIFTATDGHDVEGLMCSESAPPPPESTLPMKEMRLTAYFPQ